MSTELATTEGAGLPALPSQQTPMQAARAALREQAEMMADALQIAKGVCGDGSYGSGLMAPQRLRGKPYEGAAAILYGAELGLNPLQSLQRVIPIHGQPTLESLTMVALLEARGYTIKTVEETETVAEVHGWRPGRNADVDEPDAKSRWTIERAIKAQYVPQPSKPDSLCRPTVDSDWVTVSKTWDGKTKVSVLGNMKYITDPQAMLVAKCQARVCKSIGASVLLGIGGSTEEMRSEWYDDEPVTPTRVESVRVDSSPVTAADILGESQPVAAEPEKPKRTRKKAEPAPVVQDAETVVEPSDSSAKPEPAQVNDAASDLRKTARAKLTGAIFSMFGDAGLAKDENREDRLIVIAAIVGRTVASSNELNDEELQNLRNSLYGRQQAGTLDADINDWLNEAALREANAEDQEAAAAETNNTEGE